MNLFNRNDKSGDSLPQPQTTQPPATHPQATQLPPAQSPPMQIKPGNVMPGLAELPSPVSTAKPTPTTVKTGVPMASVISKALKITGELESTEDIQIDGEIEGDVRGVGVKIGQNAKVKGTVYGDEVELAGTIEGKIESKKVFLTGTARMTGDIWHQDIKIDSGAHIAGNLKPEAAKADSKPAPKPTVAATATVSPGSAGNAAGSAAQR
jgi:cytoskeletal protein CcmA (bactofilin family)